MPKEIKVMDQTMRAVLCESWRPFDELVLTDVPVPGPLGPNDVRIAISHAGVGWATTLVVSGRYQRKPPLPFSPGTEACGTVLDVGPDVTDLVPGDRVCAVLDYGGYAEQVVVHARHVFKLPDALPSDAAVALPISYMTAYGALMWRAGLRPDETVLVHGAAGGVGLAACDIAKAIGATVIAVARGEAKVAFLRARGVDHVIDGGHADVRGRVAELTGGRGVDVVLDPIGGPVFDAALRCLDEGGRLLVVGFVHGVIPTVPANIVLLKNISVAGFNLGQFLGWGVVDERERFAGRYRAGMEQLLEWWQDGRLAPVVHARFPLAQFREAMAEVTGRAAMGRVVLTVQG